MEESVDPLGEGHDGTADADGGEYGRGIPSPSPVRGRSPSESSSKEVDSGLTSATGGKSSEWPANPWDSAPGDGSLIFSPYLDRPPTEEDDVEYEELRHHERKDRENLHKEMEQMGRSLNETGVEHPMARYIRFCRAEGLQPRLDQASGRLNSLAKHDKEAKGGHQVLSRAIRCREHHLPRSLRPLRREACQRPFRHVQGSPLPQGS